ncbi:hypothetical protein [Clostridium perfringens]|uniref:hypothetical protein n=2 Tax=Clostridium perfringens TaxID=1502 RepID=UPI0023424D79|nr:hypothetical protein [Clostridium perfringens]ELC8436102.1 hypothetical protein [Clostridium perfringens]MDC4244355.1 hypothetical protein [Clostridium perfringens]
MTEHLSSFLGRILSMNTLLEEEIFVVMDRVFHLNSSLNEGIGYGLEVIIFMANDKNKLIIILNKWYTYFMI